MVKERRPYSYCPYVVLASLSIIDRMSLFVPFVRLGDAVDVSIIAGTIAILDN